MLDAATFDTRSHEPIASAPDFDERARMSVARLEKKYAALIRVDPRLTRKDVSFQANKSTPVLRWYKYKEGFSGALVSRYLTELEFPAQSILDPFAGAGTTLAQSVEEGFDSEGIELLPIGRLLIEARLALSRDNIDAVLADVAHWLNARPWATRGGAPAIPVLNITKGAYGAATEAAIGRYLKRLDLVRGAARDILLLALMAVLESVSFTRKDGQYLRWDHRSGRPGLKSTFNKGLILDFDTAITAKLRDIHDDLSGPLQALGFDGGNAHLHHGSCLDVLPTLESGSFGGAITSPPYCNRYDYTRTYALEHALLGTSEDETKQLRQAMLTCTVENRRKDLVAMNPDWSEAIKACARVDAFTDIVAALENQAKEGRINNPNIFRMVEGYFLEMSCVISELSRLLKRSGKVVMVNDNVRYGGIDIPVDCILSEIAGNFGLRTIEISTLARGKGNSSQQMGAHGRREMRKSVYIWEKA